jgi:hypothetical protein
MNERGLLPLSYLGPFIQNKRAIEHTAETFFKLDEDPIFLTTSSSAFLQGLGSVPGEPDDAAETEAAEESEEDVKDDHTEDEDGDRVGFGSPGPRSKEGGSGSGSEFTGLMHWSSFKHYPLSRTPDIVDDRRKSYIALAQEVEVGIPTPIGAITMKGLFGVLVRVLQPQDYRAYFKAAARTILLPKPISKKPNELELAAYERNLLGTSKFLGGSSMMTCLAYHDGDCGAITLFEVEMHATDDGGEWPKRIS